MKKMKIRLAKKIYKQREESLFPNPRNYWQVKWSNSQFYEGAIYDHRIAKAERLVLREVMKRKDKDGKCDENPK